MTDDELDAIGAGDQGMMFGYRYKRDPGVHAVSDRSCSQACKTSHRGSVKNGTLPYLRPDGKTQVTVEYDENGKPFRLEAVVLSTQHDENVTQEQIHEDIKKYVFDPILPQEMVDA